MAYIKDEVENLLIDEGFWWIDGENSIKMIIDEEVSENLKKEEEIIKEIIRISDHINYDLMTNTFKSNELLQSYVNLASYTDELSRLYKEKQ
jgi:predicted AlkP superfamily phosphohydrolase/phosphomutase